jgi:hypothetical protein
MPSPSTRPPSPTSRALPAAKPRPRLTATPASRPKASLHLCPSATSVDPPHSPLLASAKRNAKPGQKPEMTKQNRFAVRLQPHQGTKNRQMRNEPDSPSHFKAAPLTRDQQTPWRPVGCLWQLEPCGKRGLSTDVTDGHRWKGRRLGASRWCARPHRKAWGRGLVPVMGVLSQIQ